jgi:hypothetical protein
LISILLTVDDQSRLEIVSEEWADDNRVAETDHAPWCNGTEPAHLSEGAGECNIDASRRLASASAPRHNWQGIRPPVHPPCQRFASSTYARYSSVAKHWQGGASAPSVLTANCDGVH